MSNAPPPAPLVVAVRLTDLLPDLRAAVETARTPDGWDRARLAQAVAHEFDFLGAFTEAAVEPAPPPAAAGGGSGAHTPDHDGGEWLVLRFLPPPGRDLAEAERVFQKATRRAQMGEIRAALREFGRVAQQFPEVAKYHRAVGHAHLELGQLDDAEDELLRALRLDPLDPDALTMLGNLLARRGRPADAIPLYERSVALRPNVHALSNLGAMLAKAGRLDEGIGRLREAVAVDPEYPNAWYGLALALTNRRDRALVPEAIAALDQSLAAAGERRRAPEVWDAAQGLLADLTRLAAEDQSDAAAQAVRRTIVDLEERRALPVQIEEAALQGILAKIELAWVHRRPFHRLLVGGLPGPAREHYVLHELEHLTLTTEAREAGRNRWFASSEATRGRALRSIDADIRRLVKRGLPEPDAAAFARSAVDGLLNQLFNFPIDLLIETRLLERHPDCRELIYESLREQLETSARIAEDERLRAFTPPAVFRANAAMNGAFALWLEERFPRRTALVGRFQRTEAWSLAKRLYAGWQAEAARWEPGAEYGWVDTWARALGLADWYRWVEDHEPDPRRDGAPEGSLRSGRPAAQPHGGDAPVVEASTIEGANPLDAARSAAATFFLLGALEWIDREGFDRAREVAVEVARLGQRGIDYLDGEARYTVRAYSPEPVSGLQALSLMYACFRAVEPTLDPGIDLSGPYAAARQLHDARRGGRPGDPDDAGGAEAGR